MAIGIELRYAGLDELYLDPANPRLGRNVVGRELTQEEVLELMREWTLDELVVSFLDSGGFWTHEPLLVTEETLYGKKHLVVIEGNRRLAALKFLKKAVDGEKSPRKLIDIAKSKNSLRSIHKNSLCQNWFTARNRIFFRISPRNWHQRMEASGESGIYRKTH